MAGLGARIGLLMRQGMRHFVGNVLDKRAAEHDIEELLPAANAEDRFVGGERALGDRELEFGAAILGGDAAVPALGAKERRVDIEGAAGDDEAVDEVEIGRGLRRLMWQQY